MRKLLLVGLVLFFSKPLLACTVEANVEGAIGAGISDYLQRAEKKAIDKGCKSILLTLNTPGGNLQTTRMIVEQIVNSSVPVLCVVAPSGGHAGSAGAIILQACHVAGALETTNIGAATPILGTGEDVKGDLRNKMVNDTTSWLDGLTGLRGRNQQFGRDIVTKAQAVDAKKAKEMGAIDILATSLGDFLKQAEGREVKMTEGKTQKVEVGPIIEFKKDLKTAFLDLIANPQIAYLLFMGSLALLYFEITHPGTMVPGVLGALGLILALISFHILEVQWGGLALMVLGLGLLIAEAFLPSFGILGIGGIAAFVFGGLLLFDAETGGVRLSLGLVLPTAIGFGGGMMAIAFLAARAMRVKKTAGADLILHAHGQVSFIEKTGEQGQVEVMGEIWNFESEVPLSVGDPIVVTSVHDLKVKVKKRS